MKPLAIANSSIVTPTNQLISRGRRKAPVKKMRHRCVTMAARNTSAAQWWICRMTRPARTSKLRCTDDWKAADIGTPRNGTYEPW